MFIFPRNSGRSYYSFFFFNDTATTEIYTLSLHDALPIFHAGDAHLAVGDRRAERVSAGPPSRAHDEFPNPVRSEEHTSELQSRLHLVCRLLLEKKKTKKTTLIHIRTTSRPARHTRADNQY